MSGRPLPGAWKRREPRTEGWGVLGSRDSGDAVLAGKAGQCLAPEDLSVELSEWAKCLPLSQGRPQPRPAPARRPRPCDPLAKYAARQTSPWGPPSATSGAT